MIIGLRQLIGKQLKVRILVPHQRSGTDCELAREQQIYFLNADMVQSAIEGILRVDFRRLNQNVLPTLETNKVYIGVLGGLLGNFIDERGFLRVEKEAELLDELLVSSVPLRGDPWDGGLQEFRVEDLRGALELELEKAFDLRADVLWDVLELGVAWFTAHEDILQDR